MAAELVQELESGTCTGWSHPHNGYYAGDFAAAPQSFPADPGAR